MTIKEAVYESIEYHLFDGELSDDMKLIEDLDAQQLDLTEILFELEDEFDFEFDNDDFSKIVDGENDLTIKELIDKVQTYTQ